MKKESYLKRVMSFFMLAAFLMISAGAFADTKVNSQNGEFYCQNTDTDTGNAKEENDDQGSNEDSTDNSQEDYGTDETESSEESR